MPKVITPDYSQQWLFPPTLEELLPQDHPARFVREFLGQLDLPALGFPTPPSGGPGHPTFAPALLLAVWLYGYLTRIYSTRRLEAACLDQIGFLWLTGMRAPDHTTLWHFFQAHRAAMTCLFR
jgi:transposase